ncbi:uncharacterized protein LOC119309320 [Triticum dicoccoides]|uniref:uncharacterized protein LOC119309320 n=1 Tax=Triticum dicoccoides TaxID=85692 RepID=UPI001891BA85|nr:uncharacterized protein LOC119309320 [Triticum dicoccoides]
MVTNQGHAEARGPGGGKITRGSWRSGAEGRLIDGAARSGKAAGSVCVCVVAVLLLAVLAGGGCLVLYVTLPPAEVPQLLPIAGLALVALPWAFWIATCAYSCCCSRSSPPAQAAGAVERQPSRSAAVVPLPSSTNIKSALRASPAVEPLRRLFVRRLGGCQRKF